MTSQYNAGTPGAPPVGLPGFTPQPQYATPELQACAQWAESNYPQEFGRNRDSIMATLGSLQSERFVDPREFVAGVIAASRGIEVLAAERGIVPPQGQRPAAGTPGQPVNPNDPYAAVYAKPAPNAPLELPVGVDVDRLPLNYRDALKAKNVSAAVIDEFLTRTRLHAGLEKSLPEARAKWVQQAMKADVAWDNQTLESANLGDPHPNLPGSPTNAMRGPEGSMPDKAVWGQDG